MMRLDCGMNLRGYWPNLFMALVILLTTVLALVPVVVRAQEPSTSMEGKALQDAAKTMGWSGPVSKTRLVLAGQDSESIIMLWPPESAVRFFYKPVYSITNGGSYEDETIQYLRVLNLGEAGARMYLDKMVENGWHHSSYQGREAAILRAGDEICDAGGLVGYVRDLIIKVIRWKSEFS